MSRLPAKPRSELSPEQQQAHDEFHQILVRAFGENGKKFIYKDGENALLGPFPFFLAQPRAGIAFQNFVKALGSLPLPPDVRETAILTVGGYFQAGYETYSHGPQGIEHGLTRHQVDILKEGSVKPEGLSEACSVAYDVTSQLMRTPGPLPQDMWERSFEILGREETLTLLQYIGIYCYVSVILNGVDAPVPK